MNNKILHIVFPEKFFNDYISFVNTNFDSSNHTFLSLKRSEAYRSFPNLRFMRFYRWGILFYWEMYREMKKADVVILHSLQKTKVLLFLGLFRNFRKKCLWYLWGGDMYYRLSRDGKLDRSQWIKRLFGRVVSELGGAVTHFEEDVTLLRRSTGFNGAYFSCFLYPSNICRENYQERKDKQLLHIQLGNSSHPSNEHIEVLHALKSRSAIQIFAPLSYGDRKHGERVESYGRQLFSERFTALKEFMPLPEYIKFIASIDVAIFNHWRQQGSGNLVSLAGMGKTIYIRRSISTWKMFQDLGVKVFAMEDLLSSGSLSVLTEEEAKRNSAIILSYFNEDRLIEQSSAVFAFQPN